MIGREGQEELPSVEYWEQWDSCELHLGEGDPLLLQIDAVNFELTVHVGEEGGYPSAVAAVREEARAEALALLAGTRGIGAYRGSEFLLAATLEGAREAVARAAEACGFPAGKWRAADGQKGRYRMHRFDEATVATVNRMLA